MKCGKCNYEWEPRIRNPKCCPGCKVRLGTVKIKAYTGVLLNFTSTAMDERRIEENSAREDECEDIVQVRVLTDNKVIDLTYSELFRKLGIY